MTGRALVLTLLFAPLSLAAALGAEGEPVASADFALRRIAPREAFAPLRSFAGATEIDLIDAATVRVHGPAAVLARAGTVIELLELPSEPAGEPALRELADGTRLARVALGEVPAREAVTALRQLRVGGIAVFDEGAALLLHDTAPQIDAALARLARLARERP
ncbi:MAG: hypothetical protein M5U13_13105 [Thermoanaerobaculia bacterium]|nr:hypothetical protein [Thermoanaerobaculia bacterium]